MFAECTQSKSISYLNGMTETYSAALIKTHCTSVSYFELKDISNEINSALKTEIKANYIIKAKHLNITSL